MSSSLEAKIVVLGSQGQHPPLVSIPLPNLAPNSHTNRKMLTGVGKTSLLHRYISNTFSSSTPPASTLGATFLTKRILDTPSDTDVRLQIWDTAGQERFRSISRLYYRGANAGLLCYDITNERSWEDMKGWLAELREQVGGGLGGEGLVLHVVGTKSDLVAEEPARRKVAFERTIKYVASVVGGGGGSSQGATPPATSHEDKRASQSLFGALTPSGLSGQPQQHQAAQSPDSKRSSGFRGQDVGWDSCHEVSARDGEGIEEVFRVIARKLVEQRNRRLEREASLRASTPGWDGVSTGEAGGGGYFDGADAGSAGNTGSFRVGHGDKRRSWLGIPVGLNLGELGEAGESRDSRGARRKSRCC